MSDNEGAQSRCRRSTGVSAARLLHRTSAAWSRGMRSRVSCRRPDAVKLLSWLFPLFDSWLSLSSQTALHRPRSPNFKEFWVLGLAPAGSTRVDTLPLHYILRRLLIRNCSGIPWPKVGLRKGAARECQRRSPRRTRSPPRMYTRHFSV